MEEEKKNLLEQYIEWTNENGLAPQRVHGGEAPSLTTWLFAHIKDIVKDSKYGELASLLSYHGYPREMVIALFDYANADSTIDWKRNEINEFAAFILEHYLFIKPVRSARNSYTFPWFIIDTIVVCHMPMFIAKYPWDEEGVQWPLPSQIQLMVDMYKAIDGSMEVNGEKSGGGLWEWILQYGEKSPIPTSVILDAMDDAIESGNANLIAEYISPSFLRNQPLVASNGDDTDLNQVWEYVVKSMESGTAYPDELMVYYGHDSDHTLTFEELYKAIYDDLKQIANEMVAMRTIGNMDVSVTNASKVEAYYRTILANGNYEKFGLSKDSKTVI